MNIVGFEGGSSLCELGPASDVAFFFACVAQFAASRGAGENWSLLTDRLYRRYLREEESELATRMMNEVRSAFSSLPVLYLGADRLARVKTPDSRLDWGGISLASMFASYFEHFDYCVESAKLNYDAFKAHPGYVYEPVRVIVTDMPRHMIDSARSLDEYDVLVGDPVWLS